MEKGSSRKFESALRGEAAGSDVVIIMRIHGFFADTESRATLQLMLEARSGSPPIKTEPPPTQPLFGSKRAQRLACG